MTSINNIGSSEKYDCWSVDLLNDSFPEIYFVKKVQQKNERTIDHERIIEHERIIDKRIIDKRTSHKSFFSRNTFSSIIFHKK
jgi:hypothetical protein